MAESNGKGSHNETSSDDDDEYEDNSRGFNLGFIFGNVDNSGDLDADYLDEDAKEHLSALADKLGSSLPDINLLAKSERTASDPAEQDYDRKAEDAVDYEDIDEEYDGPEVQVVSEEDHLLPKKEYFSTAVALGSLKSRASVFDDEDYDEEEEQEEEQAPVEKSLETEKREPVVLKEDKALEYEEEASILDKEDHMDTEDVQEEEVDELLEGTLDDKGATPLPTLYVEDGMVILQFSEIFAIHEPPQKRDRRENRYVTCRDKYKSMDISELVEDDEEVLLKSHGRIDTHVEQADLIQLDVPFPIREGLQLVKASTIGGITPESREFTKLGRDSCIMGELLKQDFIDDNSSLCQSQLSMQVFPLDQHEWERRIIWEHSPEISGNSGEIFEPGLEPEGMLVKGTNSETEQESLNVVNSRVQVQADNNMFVPFSANLLESFGSRGSQSTNESTNKSRHHPQLLRLESQWDENHLSGNDEAGVKKIKRLEKDALGRFSRLVLRERDLGDEAWLDSIIWDSEKELSRSKLIFDLQDEQMVFEIFDNEESKNLQLHAGAMIVSRSSKSKDETFQEGCESNSGWQFNLSNDKFYMNGKSSQQLQANTNKSSVHSLRVFHSVPAIKLQTMKSKLSNKDIANFHRPKALWYPHDNELAIKQQGKLPTRGSMKIIVKSLGGKGSKLHVGIEESVSSLRAKASRKLDFKETEAVKMFYKGKELDDEKSLAAQNVQPNSLVHLIRTKVHLWPWAQKLPGENKSLRPPGAFKKKSDLSTKDGHVFLMEYCEERPLMLSNAGMGANLCTYYQKSSPEDQRGNLLRNQSDTLGNVMILEPGDKSPFLGEIHAGCSQSSVETNMYKAPIFPQRLQSTDYLLVRSPKGKLSLRRIDKIVVVGQQEPRMEVMSPGSKNLQTYLVNRMLVYVYREFFKRGGGEHPIAADELSFLFSNLTDAIIKKNMKIIACWKRDKNGQSYWTKKDSLLEPPESELKKLVAPEHVCSYESMLAGLYRLKHLGITRFTLPASISNALAQLPDEAIALAAASHIERELQITPWNLSSNFVACTNQDRANIERLEITGVGDPSGRGLGFSYVRAAPKAPAAAGHMKKKAAAGRGAPTVTGTDADLRRLSMEAAREVLIKFNVPDEIIAKQTRWHRIAMIRKLSSEQAASGVKVDPTTIGKYARGQRMSFLQMQQQAREKCQEIWDRQLLSLSAFDGDENESENEANSDLDSFAGDLENLLDAEEGGEGEESNISKNDKLDGVKGLKMRRRPSQVETDEEIEDEATEYAELCRLLMQDEDQKKKKKKMKGVGEGMGSYPPPRPNIALQSGEPVRKANAMDKKPIAIQPDASFLVNESTIKDNRNVDSIIKTPKGKQVKENSNSLGQLKKVKILNENLKVFKEKKSARENFVCGACGQHGHMRTNKHCPRYRENTESQPEGIDMDKSAGKPSSSEPSGLPKLKPIKNSKAAPKSAMKTSVDEALKGDKLSSKTGGLPLKFRYGIPAGDLSDKPVSEAPGSSEQAVVSDIDTGIKSTSKISKLKISSKAKPKESKGESERRSHSLMPTFSRERGESESHKPSVSGQPLSSTERNQAASSRHTISIPRPSLSMDTDQAESRRPHLVIRPPTEREQPQKKLVIKRSKEMNDHDMSSLEESPRFESRKTKRMAELAGFQRQQSFRLSENSLERRPKEDRVWWEEEEISTGRHREVRARRDYDDMSVSEEPNEIAEIRRYEEVIRSEREEEERQKAKKKKKKKKLQPEIVEGYLEDYPPRKNDRRLSERGRNVRSRYVSDFERDGAEYAPQPKRRKKGEVGLANILERIVDTLRLKEEVSRLFLKPVSKKEAPDYLDIVENPMDLSTIRDKVRKIEYRNREQFRHDVWQIKYNAHLYNDGRNPGIPPLADQLLEICDYLLDDYEDHVETDEVYAQMTLQPLTPEEQKETFVPIELGIPSKQPSNYFCKTLTASDTSTHGGFSVPRRAAEKVFPPLDYTLQPPAQELIARDLHDVEWKFRHIFRGQPKRHLLTTGWSVFVSAKRLVAGDSVIFIRNEKNQLFLGIRHATRPQTIVPSSVLSSDSMHIGLLAAAAHASATNSCFTVFFHPRASQSEFVIQLSKYIKAVFHTRISVGMRFRMLFETEESSVRRYMGTITGISDLDSVRWPNSHWRSVKVGWDESTAGERQPRVSLWEIEPLTTFPMYPSLFPLRLKRPWHAGTSSLPDGRGDLGSGLTWLRGGGGEQQGLLPLNYPSVGLFPWMQQRLDLSQMGTDNNQQYQAMLAAGLQNIGGGDPLRQQFVQLQEPHHQYLQQSASHNSDLMLQQQQQQQASRHLMHAQTQIMSENLPQQNMRQEVSNQPAGQQQQLQQPDQNAYLNAFKMQNGHLQQWQQQSEMPSPSFMKSDFTDSSNKFATTASPASGDGNLLNFSITGQSVLPEQLTTEGWSPKASNTFSEPLSLPQAYPGKSLALEPGNPQNPSLFGVDPDSGLFLPSTVPRFASSSGDAEASPMSLTDSGFQNSLYSCMQDTTHELLHGAGQINSSNQTKNFVKVYKSGSVGRSLDISRFSSYHELREELGKMFAIEGLLEDPLRSGWQLVFVDKENDILLLGDDPWESFVNNVWYIKILSPEDVHQMGDHGEGSGGLFPQNPTHL